MNRAAILAFHAVEEGPGPLCIPPAVFTRQVAALAEAGAVAFTVTELSRRLRLGELPEKAVAFTFDDGYASVHCNALPILHSHGFVATVYPVTSQLGGTNEWDAPHRQATLQVLDRAALVELAATGWEVGGHTHTHQRLAGLARLKVQQEIAMSRSVLEDLLGTPVRSFAYPYGAWDATSRRLVGESHLTCLGIGAALAGPNSPADLLERVDGWYLRRAWQLRHLHDPAGLAYLTVRRAGRFAARRLRSNTNAGGPAQAREAG